MPPDPLNARKIIPFHPFLFALYFIIQPFYSNFKTTLFYEIIFPTLLLLSATGFLYFGLARCCSNLQKAASLTSITIFFLLSRRHLSFLSSRLFAVSPHLAHIRSLTSDLNNFLIYIYILLYAAACLIILRSIKNDKKLTEFLNILSIILLGIAGSLVIKEEIKTWIPWNRFVRYQKQSIESAACPTAQARPDIYFIICDGYARQDVLKDNYGLDNAEFLDFLNKKGFFVCSRSLSNYGQTLFSFASSLNLNLVPDLRISKGRAPSDRKMLSWLIRRNFASSYLKKCGYRVFHLVPEYAGISANSSADITLKGHRLFLKQWVLNDFNNLLLRNSFLFPLLKFIPIENALYRNLVLETFQELKNAAPQKGPKFVFCYILLPHPPFVFESDGRPNKQTTRYFTGDGSMYEGSPASYRDGYRKQIQFVNKKLKELIAFILDHSPSDPVIILQGDHGPGSQLNWENPAASNMKERLAILNAYYLPNKDISPKNPERIPADDMTPVNSFRFIFNLYFNTDYPMIKNKSCLASWKNPFDCYSYTEPENKPTSQDDSFAF